MARGNRAAHSALGAPGCRAQGAWWEQNQTSELARLLVNEPSRALGPALRVKPGSVPGAPGPQGPREEVGLPHSSESKEGMMT